MTTVRISGAAWDVLTVRITGPGLDYNEPNVTATWIENPDAWREFAGGMTPEEWAQQNPEFWTAELETCLRDQDDADDGGFDPFDADYRRCGWD